MVVNYNYNYEYECRYHKDDIFSIEDVITDEEKEYVRTVLYREDLLNIFSLEDSGDFIQQVDEILSQLYEEVRGNKKLKKFMQVASSKILSEDEELGLCILYSFDYMFLTHLCIGEYLKTGRISEKHMEVLWNELNSHN
jgi:hypothetical protein